jgi:exodeoxyribonuclease VII large subunit
LQQKNELRQEIKQFKYASTQLLQENKHNLASLKQQIVQKTISFINFKEAQLKQIQVFLQTRTKFSTYNQLEKLKMSQANLRKYLGLQIQQKQNLISDNSLYILQHVPKLFIKQNEELQQIEKNLQLVDPQNVLKRGYSMVLNKEKRLVNSQNIQVDEEIEIINFDSKITSKVLKITQNG